ncbi:MAG TPA: hypothetical protein VH934_20655 [Xanthobacteraceae bacterium]
MTSAPAAGGRRRHRGAGRGLLFAPLLVFGVMTLAALGYIGYVLWPRWPAPPVDPDAPALPITVAGVAFELPPAAIRVPVQRRPGAQERVDLAFLWPSLAPPEPSANSTAAPPAERVFVTISAAGDGLDPTERVRSVYLRYTAAAAAPGPAGLIVLAFREGTPYQGEDLIYDTETPSFLVRCSRNGAGPTPGICLYQRRIEGADITLRFPRDWLADWRTVVGTIDRLIARMHPRH